MDRASFWICGYRFCVAVSVFEAFAMGRSVLSLYRWNSTAPTPASEASHEIPTGRLEDYQLEVKFKPDVTPRFCKPRTVPFAVQEDLNQAYDAGIAKGIWEPTKMPAPSNVTQLRSFLGSVQFYNKFLPDLSTISGPLYHLTEKSTKWKWDQPQEDAFKKLKQMLTDNTVLAHFDPILVANLSLQRYNRDKLATRMGSKCARTVLSVSICFNFLKASSCGWSHFHLVLFSVRW